MNDQQDPQAAVPAESASAMVRASSTPIEGLLSDVPLAITVELGRVRMSLREVTENLGPGAVLTLNKLTGEKLDVLVNQRLVARGEAVAVGDRYGIRITELISSPKETQQ